MEVAQPQSPRPEPNAPLPPHQRYQFKPYTGSSHSWALAALDSLPRGARVLDIGCGAGLIGGAMRSRGFDALYAVEIDAETRERARPVYRRIEASIEPFLNERFDVLLLLDVIEHMAEPEAFLSRASSLVAPGGLVLVSVPNVAHWSVRFPLLFGRFEYSERGLLDRTHLQLFTKRRVLQIAQRVPEFALRSYEGSIAPAEFVLPNWVSDSAWFETLRRVRKKSACLLPGICAFQHLAVFERRA